MSVDKVDGTKEARVGGMAEEQNNNQSSASEDADNEEKSSRMDAAKAFFRSMYAGADPEAEPSTGGAVDNRRVQELERALKDAEQKTAEAESLYKRMAADFDNFRRRVDREREEYSNLGVRKTVEFLLPALDDLERALSYLKPDVPTDKVIESFELVSSRIFSCLDQAGLKRINTKEALFDPHFHEPVQQIETTEHPDGTVVGELRAGYSLGDKVIRPALVNVASNNSAVESAAVEASESAAHSGEKGRHVQSSEGKKAKGKSKAEPGEDKVYDLGDMEDLDV